MCGSLHFREAQLIQQDVEFPTEVIEIEHPYNGKMYLTVYKDGGCVECIDIAEEGFWYYEFSELVTLIQTKEAIKVAFFKAKDFKKGLSPATWGSQNANQGFFHLNEMGCQYDGFTKEQFKLKHRCDAEALGLPPIPLPHPVSKEMVDIFWAPAPGPLFSLRCFNQEFCGRKTNAMTSQIHEGQAVQTVEHLRSAMQAQSQWKDILVSQSRFDELMQNARASGLVAQSPASFGRTPAQGPPRRAPSVDATPPLTMLPPMLGAARPSLVGALRPVAPRCPASVSNQSAAAPATPAIVAARMFSQTNAVGVLRPVSPAGPASPSLKRQSVLATPPKCGSDEGMPPSKRIRAPIQAAASPKVGALSFTPGAPRVKQFAGQRQSPRAANDTVSEPCLSDAGTDFFAELGADITDKFDRAIAKAPVSYALKGINMKQALSNLQRLETFGATRDDYENSQKCTKQMSIVRLGVCCTWKSLLVQSWEMSLEKASNLLQLIGQEELPQENVAAYACRRGLEFAPPRSRTFQNEKFWETVCLHQPQREKQPCSLMTPTLWCSKFDADAGKPVLSAAFTQLIVEGLYIPQLGKGALGIPMLMELAEIVATRIESYPQDIQELLSEVCLKTRCLFQLHGERPFLHGSNISDVEAVLKLKKDLFVVLVSAEKSVHKRQIDLAWSQFSTECAVWPDIEAALLRYSESKGANLFIDTYLQSIHKWKPQVRQATTKMLEIFVESLLMDQLLNMDWNKEDDASKEVGRPLLERARKAMAFAPSSTLGDALRAATDFSAKLASTDMKSAMMQGASAFMAVTDDKIEEALTAFGESLPQHEGVCLCFTGDEEVSVVTSAVEKLVSYGAKRFPACRPAADLSKRATTAVRVSEPSKAEAQDKWKIQVDASNKLLELHVLGDACRAYVALGLDAQARVDTDTNCAAIKKVIRAMKVLNFPLDEHILKLFSGESVRDLEGQAKSAQAQHGTIHIAKFQPKLTGAHSLLQPGMLGASDGASWKESLMPMCTKADLVGAANKSLRVFDVSRFIQLIKSVSTDLFFFNISIIVLSNKNILLSLRLAVAGARQVQASHRLVRLCN